ncbi:MAG: tRNA (guanosine(46)-N7)-methyltransferase TrmB [Synergistaceae bacterium]|jgi:tRNA (guanine-N7-)-methyltransferase|nr:tRNA (guanosine(46)-N7)-methyltransferase TrmB [Synergistaceae bacterium]
MYWDFRGIVTDSKRRFRASDGPMTLEIGFGNGEYLQSLASSNPDALAIGMEVSQWCISKAARRTLANGLKNIRLLWGDARYLLKYAFEPESVSGVFMNFPCPWPKRRHADRRVAGGGFAELLASRLAHGGTFKLTTDVGWYAEQTRRAFAECGAFDAAPVACNPISGCRTKYERKWRGMGRDIYELVAAKIAPARTHFAHEGDDGPMEELEAPLRGSRDFSADILSLAGDVVEGPDYRAVFREVFLSEGDAALVKVISVDEGFEQHYYLKIIYSEGKLRARADSVGHPYKTPAVRESLKHVMRKLA